MGTIYQGLQCLEKRRLKFLGETKRGLERVGFTIKKEILKDLVTVWGEKG
jgi:preprotein translocase subunit SecE